MLEIYEITFIRNMTLETGMIHSCKLNYTKICWTEVQRKLESNYQEGKWLGPKFCEHMAEAVFGRSVLLHAHTKKNKMAGQNGN